MLTRSANQSFHPPCQLHGPMTTRHAPIQCHLNQNPAQGPDSQADVYRNIIRIILSSRPEIYASPNLSEVNNNGGDRINKKVQQILKKMADGSGLPGAGGMIQEEIAKLGRMKKGPGGGVGSAPSSPKKGNGKPSPGKKRKVEEESREATPESEED